MAVPAKSLTFSGLNGNPHTKKLEGYGWLATKFPLASLETNSTPPKFVLAQGQHDAGEERRHAGLSSGARDSAVLTKSSNKEIKIKIPTFF